MYDLSKQTVIVTCEGCGRHHQKTLGQVAAGHTIHCPCGLRTKLKDSDGSVAQGIRNVNDGFKKLGDTMKRMNGR